MTPNKLIPRHSFSHGVYIDVEAELIALLSEQVVAETEWDSLLTGMGITELLEVEPMEELPVGNLFYYDFQFQSLEEPTVYDDGSWSYQNLFEGVMGIKSEIKDHKFV